MKRFYKIVSVTEGPDGFGVALDGRPIRTPLKGVLAMPARPLADAVAAEWAGQGETIDPHAMPLTRSANTAIDRVTRDRAAIEDQIIEYAGSDLVCYRAASPVELVSRQAAAWDPVLGWAKDRFGLAYRLTEGVMPVPQDPATLDRYRGVIAGEDAFRLTGLHMAMTLTGSALLALALLHRHLDADAAWAAAQVDEAYQAELWGRDAEAEALWRRRRRDLDDAARFLSLLDGA